MSGNNGKNGRAKPRRRKRGANGAADPRNALGATGGNGSQRVTNGDMIKLRDALAQLQVLRHQAAIATHVGQAIVADFLYSDSGQPRYTITGWAGGTEPARAEAVLALQRALELEADRARTQAEELLEVALGPVPPDLLALVLQEPPKLAQAYGQPKPWSQPDEAVAKGAGRTEAPCRALIGIGGSK
jgi:hypothetical protein